ncbi:MAG: hypothetical protein WCD76_21040 [Pyrinomonadaceae bacterium]
MLCLTTICFALTCRAQVASPGSNQNGKAQIVERLADGDYVVAIEGVEYRAVTAEHARQIGERKAEAERQTKVREILDLKIANYENAIGLSKKDVTLADTQAALERERAEKFMALYEGEKGLRLQAERLNAHGGRVSKLFDNPYMQVGLKLGMPIVQTVLTAQRE